MRASGIVYSELLDLLQRKPSSPTGGLLGILTGLSPLTVKIQGREIDQGLLCPRGTVFHQEDLGAEIALLPCEAGFLILFQVEEGSR